MESKKDRKCILGLYHRASNVGLILEFNSWSELENTMSDKSKNLRELDTNILHTFLLKDVFNIDTNNQEDLKYLSYFVTIEPNNTGNTKNKTIKPKLHLPPVKMACRV